MLCILATGTNIASALNVAVDLINKGVEWIPETTTPSSTTKAIDDKSTEDKPSEEKSAEVKPTELKPAEEKPTEGKRTDEKPAEVKPAEEKPTEEKPTEEKREAKELNVAKNEGKLKILLKKVITDTGLIDYDTLTGKVNHCLFVIIVVCFMTEIYN